MLNSLPITLKQTRRGYLHDYVVAFMLAGVSIYLAIAFNWVWIPIIIAALALIAVLLVELHVFNHTLHIDHEKVLITSGVFSRANNSSPFHNLTDFNTEQTFWERIMGYGTLSINTAGGHHPLEFHKLKNPNAIREALLKQIQKHHAPRSHEAHL